MVTQRELDDFLDKVERLGHDIRYAGISASGSAEVGIDKGWSEQFDEEWDYKIERLAGMTFLDYHLNSVSDDFMSIMLF